MTGDNKLLWTLFVVAIGSCTVGNKLDEDLKNNPRYCEVVADGVTYPHVSNYYIEEDPYTRSIIFSTEGKRVVSNNYTKRCEPKKGLRR